MLTILFNKVEHFDDLMGLGPFRVEADISFSYSVVKGQLNGISRDLFDGRTLSSGQVGNPARPRRGWGPSGSGRGLGAMGALPWSRLGLFRRARSGVLGPACAGRGPSRMLRHPQCPMCPSMFTRCSCPSSWSYFAVVVSSLGVP